MTTLPLTAPPTPTPSGTGSSATRSSRGDASSNGFGALLADALSDPTPTSQQEGAPGDEPITGGPADQLTPGSDVTPGPLGAGEQDLSSEAGTSADELTHASAVGESLLLSPVPFSLAEAVRASAPGTPAAAPTVPATAGVPTDATGSPTVPTTGQSTGQADGQTLVPTATTSGAEGTPGSWGTADRGTAALPVAGVTQETPSGARVGSGSWTGTEDSAEALPQGAGATEPEAATDARAAAGAAPVAAAGGAGASGSTNTLDLSALTPVAAPTASSAPSGTGASTAATAPAPVAQQVLPDVSRLVQRGDGTHRLTLTLTPEALGDVRITLTVRQGEVSVSFAAGDQARRALIESTPELRRLLELGGATASRITVGDLASVRPADGAGQAAAQESDARLSQGDDHAGHGPGSQDGGRGTPGSDHTPQDHHARTRGGSSATDGTHRGTGDTGRPLNPGTSSRPAGLDVTV